jgi:hypothetical protein
MKAWDLPYKDAGEVRRERDIHNCLIENIPCPISDNNVSFKAILRSREAIQCPWLLHQVHGGKSYGSGPSWQATSQRGITGPSVDTLCEPH